MRHSPSPLTKPDRPSSPLARSTRKVFQIFKIFSAIIILWNLWFFTKIALASYWLKESTDKGEIYADMSNRVSDAVLATQDLLLVCKLLALSLIQFLVQWTHVVLPFVKDSWFVGRFYVFPFVKDRVVVPAYEVTAPVLKYVWSVHIVEFLKWLDNTIPLQYKIGLILLIVLVFNKRMSKFWKLHILLLIGYLSLAPYIWVVLVNPTVKALTFMVTPFVLALIELGGNKELRKVGNFLFFISLSPVFWLVDSIEYLKSFNPVSLVYVSLMFTFVTGFYISISTADIAKEYLQLSSITCIRKQKHVQRVSQQIRVWITNHPRFYQLMNKLENAKIKFSIILNKFSVISITQLSTISWRSPSSIRSMAVLFVVISTLLGGIMYFAYSAFSRFVGYALWPWFISDSLKVVFYQRTSDYTSQLSFALLFLFYELVVLRINIPVFNVVASMLHLPMIFLLKLVPTYIAAGLMKLVLFLPQLASSAPGKSLQKMD